MEEIWKDIKGYEGKYVISIKYVLDNEIYVVVINGSMLQIYKHI